MRYSIAIITYAFAPLRAITLKRVVIKIFLKVKCSIRFQYISSREAHVSFTIFFWRNLICPYIKNTESGIVNNGVWKHHFICALVIINNLILLLWCWLFPKYYKKSLTYIWYPPGVISILVRLITHSDCAISILVF